MFEDALYALKTARADGFPTAAVYDPHEPGQKELRELADLLHRGFFLIHIVRIPGSDGGSSGGPGAPLFAAI